VSTEGQPSRSCVLQLFRTRRNIFGLSKIYSSTERPSHDPDEFTTLHDLSGSAKDTPFQQGTALFYPYPNLSSFRLGEWYWNHGIQKSQESFKDLLRIITDHDFAMDDIRQAKWSEINNTLAGSDLNEDQNQNEWLVDDAGWERTPISITIPFHRRMKNPGPKRYVVGDFFHRSLVSVIKEKLANRNDDERFHYEPYKYLWRPNDRTTEIRVHGELYTSPAFEDAHLDLQESPGEPGCELPRVVVALMFSSDATHLTSFGNAKLWPCYLFFGNESKYRRCKPSQHLCSHVAYFQSVSFYCLFPISLAHDFL
jgi:hypothetical protein